VFWTSNTGQRRRDIFCNSGHQHAHMSTHSQTSQALQQSRVSSGKPEANPQSSKSTTQPPRNLSRVASRERHAARLRTQNWNEQWRGIHKQTSKPSQLGQLTRGPESRTSAPHVKEHHPESTLRSSARHQIAAMSCMRLHLTRNQGVEIDRTLL